MSARRFKLPVWLLWLAPAIVGTLLSPASAHAGCGGHDRPVVAGTDAGLTLLALAEEAVVVPDEKPGEPSRPCTGPTCSRRRGSPATPPTVFRIATERANVVLRVEPLQGVKTQRVVVIRQALYEPPADERPERPPRP